MKRLSTKQNLHQSTSGLPVVLLRLTQHIEYIQYLYQSYKEVANSQLNKSHEGSSVKGYIYVLLHLIVFINYRRAVRHSSLIDDSNEQPQAIVAIELEDCDTRICTLKELSKELRDKSIKETFQNMQNALSA